jgi:hypothetical protein
VESDSKDKSLAITRCNGVPITALGVDAMIKFKTIKNVTVNPIGKHNLQFRRVTNRYGRKGTFSNHQGYLSVSRCAITGRFTKRPA